MKWITFILCHIFSCTYRQICHSHISCTYNTCSKWTHYRHFAPDCLLLLCSHIYIYSFSFRTFKAIQKHDFNFKISYLYCTFSVCDRWIGMLHWIYCWCWSRRYCCILTYCFHGLTFLSCWPFSTEYFWYFCFISSCSIQLTNE